MLLAGEESGLIYARAIAEKARAMYLGVEIRGYSDYGFETHDLAVMGFWAVLRRILFFLRVKRTMERAIAEWKPDAVCTVDYPGMNLKLAAFAKMRGIRAVHVVCPQVWAWKAGRIPKIEASLDRLCCFFPFEPALFSPGFAEFVGHPLAAAFPSSPRQRGGSERGASEIALLPGSRLGEIERHLPTMLRAVEGLDAHFSIPAANERAYEAIAAVVESSGRAGVSVRLGGARDALMHADCAVVASGTATLEAALAGCPTVLVYRVSPLLAWFARRVIKGVRHVGLANIVWEKSRPESSDAAEAPMPELLQERFTAENVRRYLDLWTSDGKARAEASRRLSDAVALLSRGSDPVARIAEMLG